MFGCGRAREAMFTGAAGRDCQHRGVAHRVYLVGGPARVGKSSLAQRLLRSDGIAWLPTDVLRTVLRRVRPELDDLDQGDVPAAAVGEFMYPHIAQAVEVCSEEAERFLVEGPDIVPSMVSQLSAALPGVMVRACFLPHPLGEGRTGTSRRSHNPSIVSSFSIRSARTAPGT
jgi:hypothetical protein